MAEVSWIKIYTDMFERSRKIKQIELMPEGDTILVIWFKLLILAGVINDGGRIYITPQVPFTHESLAYEVRRPLPTVKVALSTFIYYGMIEDNNGFIKVTNWEEYQNIDGMEKLREYNRLAKQKSRAKQKALMDVNDKSMTSQECQDTEEERRIKKEDKEYHSINHYDFADEKNDIYDTSDSAKREYLGGTLGQGVVMLSEDENDDLLDKLSFDEYHKYIKIVADKELKGHHYKKKTHYQAILDMAMADRKKVRRS